MGGRVTGGSGREKLFSFETSIEIIYYSNYFYIYFQRAGEKKRMSRIVVNW